jgi:hypothetical protein
MFSDLNAPDAVRRSWLRAQGIPLRALRDGESIIIDGN